MNEKMLEFQQKNTFPSSSLPDWFIEACHKAMLFFSPPSAKMLVEDFTAMVAKTEYTLYDMGFILHVMEMRTAKDMGMDLPAYCAYMSAIEAVAKEWRGMVQPYSDQLGKELAEFQRKEQEDKQAAFDAAAKGNGETIALGQA